MGGKNAYFSSRHSINSHLLRFILSWLVLYVRYDEGGFLGASFPPPFPNVKVFVPEM